MLELLSMPLEQRTESMIPSSPSRPRFLGEFIKRLRSGTPTQPRSVVDPIGSFHESVPTPNLEDAVKPPVQVNRSLDEILAGPINSRPDFLRNLTLEDIVANRGLVEVPDEVGQHAKAIYQRVQADPSEKIVVISMDDEQEKLTMVVKAFSSPDVPTGKEFITAEYLNAKHGVAFYQALRTLAQDRQVDVITALDGMLMSESAPFELGIKIARKLAVLSAENHWPMPFLVGISSNSDHNGRLLDAFPNQYISGLSNARHMSYMAPLIKAKLSKGGK